MHQSRQGDLDRYFDYYRTVNFKADANSMNSRDLRHLAQKITTILTSIKLQKNSIDSTGCLILSQAKWANLHHLRLNSNLINSLGCKYLTRGNWPLLQSITLDLNKIQKQGLHHLSKNSWKMLTQFSIDQNYITSFENIKFKNEKSFIKLNFDWNPLNAFGVQALLVNQFDNAEEIILRIAVFKLGDHSLIAHLRQKYPKVLIFSF